MGTGAEDETFFAVVVGGGELNLAKDMKLEFMGGRLYRLVVENVDRFDIVRYVTDLYRKNPQDFQDVVIEIVYDVMYPLSAKDKNFIKWRIRSFTAGNINVNFVENVSLEKDRVSEKVVPLRKTQTVSLVDVLKEEKEQEEKKKKVNNIVLGTLRGGAEIDSDKGVIIVGDVHAGADIYSDGPVIVLGTLAGRIFLLSDKSYAIVRVCDNGLVIYDGKAYDCDRKDIGDKWVAFLPHKGEVKVYVDKIGQLARRVKRWLEE